MKFVHLAPQPYIARIRKNGIHCGNGRCGRGVYAVPLMLLPQLALMHDDRVIEATPRSSSTLWKWLSRGRRHQNLAAIVFDTARSQLPVDLYVELDRRLGTAWIDDLPSEQITADQRHLELVRQAIAGGILATLKLTIYDADSTGIVLHALQRAGIRTIQRFDDSLELVFPSPVAPSLIRRVIPLYRSNQQFKRDRHRREMPD